MSGPVLVLVALGLVVGNAFFVAVEFSLLAARRGRIEAWAEEGRVGAASALAGMQHLNVQLAACQLGITVLSLLLGWLIEPVVSHALEGLLESGPLPPAVASGIGVALGLGLVALVHMVLGEMVPKSVALTAPERTAVVVAPVQRAVVVVVRPIVWALDGLSRAGTRLLGVEPSDELGQAHTAAELSAMLEESARLGEVEAADHLLLSGALGFLEETVADVMTPREALVTVPATATVSRAEDLVHASGHSRVLVVGERSADDVVGFLHAKDLLRLPAGAADGLLPPGLVRVALQVRPDERLTELLPRMRRARRHVAVVVAPDAAGVQRLLGLVTLEDVLEAIVGDIRDETDRDGADPDEGA